MIIPVITAPLKCNLIAGLQTGHSLFKKKDWKVNLIEIRKSIVCVWQWNIKKLHNNEQLLFLMMNFTHGFRLKKWRSYRKYTRLCNNIMFSHVSTFFLEKIKLIFCRLIEKN